MEPKGYILINKEFVATKIWPGEQFTLSGIVDLDKEYKEALAGRMIMVLEVGVDGSYLVLGRSKTVGDFIWQVEKEDTRDGSFLPIKYKFGTFMPTNLSPMEEFKWMAEHITKQGEEYTKDFDKK
jgi:hypothetical protein